jgi:hypothetical protein
VLWEHEAGGSRPLIPTRSVISRLLIVGMVRKDCSLVNCLPWALESSQKGETME